MPPHAKPVDSFDLVIMRAVLHYNSHADQIEILKSLQQTLAPSGKLVAQILTGSPMNCSLKLDLISQKTLGDDIHTGYYNCHTFDELRQMLNSIGFASVQLMGSAPDLKWTLEQQWTRFNGLINDEPRGGDGPFAQTTKTNTGRAPLGPDGFAQLRKLTTKPVMAIGGLKPDNSAPLVAAGADGLAVVSAIVGADDPAAASRAFAALYAN